MNRSRMCARIYTMAGVALLSSLGGAQAADPYPQPQQYQSFPQQQPGTQPHPMRAMFAATVAQVAQTTGSAAIVTLADGLTGALKGWFDNRRQRKVANGTLGNTQSYPPPAPDPGQYPQTGYPQTNYPQTDYPQQDGSQPPSTSGDYPYGAVPDSGNGGYPSSGYPNTGGNAPSGYPAPNAAPSQLYAGIAYEIHLLQADGSTLPVDAANYSFRTGDQFRVFYRPSLPGRVDVFNINPAGNQALIDSSIVASGELASLGPYQFTDLQGDETLILKLSPCMTPTLAATTRSIVKVPGPQSNYPASYQSNNAMGLGDCSATATRGLKTKTRDIRKVTVEGGTSFALDPIASNELGAGDLSPRQVTLTLHHR
ncbi:MAG: hypothetical protein ABI821_09150 [Pseudomonadota bacterium]